MNLLAAVLVLVLAGMLAEYAVEVVQPTLERVFLLACAALLACFAIVIVTS